MTMLEAVKAVRTALNYSAMSTVHWTEIDIVLCAAESEAKREAEAFGMAQSALGDIRDALNSPMEPSLSRMTHQQLIEEQARVLRVCSAVVDAYFATGEKEG